MPATAQGISGESILAILAAVRLRTGLDFSEYRPATVLRRIRARMARANAADAGAYLERILRDEGECAALARSLTVKVSRLFRGPAAFEAVAAALPSAVSRPPAAAWSAGCARGEEAWSLALLAESLAPPLDLDVLGTDVDDEALRAAAEARFGEEALTDVPDALRGSALVPSPDPRLPWQIAPRFRPRVVFRRHDLASAREPPGRFALVACRNVLIYLQPAAQARVQDLLVAALAPGGLLWLGEAEWPAPALSRRLEVVDRGARLFRTREAA